MNKDLSKKKNNNDIGDDNNDIGDENTYLIPKTNIFEGLRRRIVPNK